MISEGSCDTEN